MHTTAYSHIDIYRHQTFEYIWDCLRLPGWQLADQHQNSSPPSLVLPLLPGIHSNVLLSNCPSSFVTWSPAVLVWNVVVSDGEAQNDIGFGTIVGSAVFNVLFVIGLRLPLHIRVEWSLLQLQCSVFKSLQVQSVFFNWEMLFAVSLGNHRHRAYGAQCISNFQCAQARSNANWGAAM